ncbi:MAG TPA: hypothetical protein ENI73_05540 [Spirochaetes bacterium]|nr:hypothetical protein [Spirochaetota bacterium]
MPKNDFLHDKKLEYLKELETTIEHLEESDISDHLDNKEIHFDVNPDLKGKRTKKKLKDLLFNMENISLSRNTLDCLLSNNPLTGAEYIKEDILDLIRQAIKNGIELIINDGDSRYKAKLDENNEIKLSELE